MPIIARLPEADQPAVATYAATPTEGGKRPGRDDVQAFIAARRPAKVVRTKAFAGELDGRKFRVELRAGDTHEALVEFLKALSALVARHKAVPVPNLTLVAGG